MGCDYYIYTYLHIYFQKQEDNPNIIHYLPVCISCKNMYFEYDDSTDNYDPLVPNKPILIYSKNQFENNNYERKYKEIIQDKIYMVKKKWENVTTIKKVERRFEIL